MVAAKICFKLKQTARETNVLWFESSRVLQPNYLSPKAV